jgi:hypothetical protein
LYAKGLRWNLRVSGRPVRIALYFDCSGRPYNTAEARYVRAALFLSLKLNNALAICNESHNSLFVIEYSGMSDSLRSTGYDGRIGTCRWRLRIQTLALVQDHGIGMHLGALSAPDNAS